MLSWRGLGSRRPPARAPPLWGLRPPDSAMPGTDRERRVNSGGRGERGNSGRKPSGPRPAPRFLLLPLAPVFPPPPRPALGLCGGPRVLALPPGPCTGFQALAPPLPRPHALVLPLALASCPSPFSASLSSCPVPRSSFRPHGAGAGRTKAGLPLRRAGYLLVPGSSD